MRQRLAVYTSIASKNASMWRVKTLVKTPLVVKKNQNLKNFIDGMLLMQKSEKGKFGIILKRKLSTF